MIFQTSSSAGQSFVPAPDGSEIRPLVSVSRGSMVHCTLRPGQVSRAVRHRTVEEVWYCVGGGGEVWRCSAAQHQVVSLRPGTALTIPLGTAFQFRATGEQPLEVVITTMPPWPGEDEAVLVEGTWEPSV